MTNRERSIEKRRKTLTKIAKELNFIYTRSEWQAATGISPPPSQFDPRKIQPLVDRANFLLRQAKQILDAYVLSDEPDDLMTEGILAEVMPQILPLAKSVRNERKEIVHSAIFDRGDYGPGAKIMIQSKSLPEIESLPFGRTRAQGFVDAAAKAGKPLIAVDYIDEHNFQLLPGVPGTFAQQQVEFSEILQLAAAKGVEVVVVRFDVQEYFKWLRLNDLEDNPETEKQFRMTLAAPACFQTLDRDN